MIALPPLGELEDRLWLALMDIAERRAADWTLVGGQMVLLHALEHGVTPPRISTDLDLVVDARVRPPAIPAMAEVLDDLGFRLGGIARDGVGHRFVGGRSRIEAIDVTLGRSGQDEIFATVTARTCLQPDRLRAPCPALDHRWLSNPSVR